MFIVQMETFFIGQMLWKIQPLNALFVFLGLSKMSLKTSRVGAHKSRFLEILVLNEIALQQADELSIECTPETLERLKAYGSDSRFSPQLFKEDEAGGCYFLGVPVYISASAEGALLCIHPMGSIIFWPEQ